MNEAIRQEMEEMEEEEEWLSRMQEQLDDRQHRVRDQQTAESQELFIAKLQRELEERKYSTWKAKWIQSRESDFLTLLENREIYGFGRRVARNTSVDTTTFAATFKFDQLVLLSFRPDLQELFVAELKLRSQWSTYTTLQICVDDGSSVDDNNEYLTSVRPNYGLVIDDQDHRDDQNDATLRRRATLATGDDIAAWTITLGRHLNSIFSPEAVTLKYSSSATSTLLASMAQCCESISTLRLDFTVCQWDSFFAGTNPISGPSYRLFNSLDCLIIKGLDRRDILRTLIESIISLGKPVSIEFLRSFSGILTVEDAVTIGKLFEMQSLVRATFSELHLTTDLVCQMLCARIAASNMTFLKCSELTLPAGKEAAFVEAVLSSQLVGLYLRTINPLDIYPLLARSLVESSTTVLKELSLEVVHNDLGYHVTVDVDVLVNLLTHARSWRLETFSLYLGYAQWTEDVQSALALYIGTSNHLRCLNLILSHASIRQAMTSQSIEEACELGIGSLDNIFCRGFNSEWTARLQKNVNLNLNRQERVNGPLFEASQLSETVAIRRSKLLMAVEAVNDLTFFEFLRNNKWNCLDGLLEVVHGCTVSKKRHRTDEKSTTKHWKRQL